MRIRHVPLPLHIRRYTYLEINKRHFMFRFVIMNTLSMLSVRLEFQEHLCVRMMQVISMHQMCVKATIALYKESYS